MLLLVIQTDEAGLEHVIEAATGPHPYKISPWGYNPEAAQYKSQVCSNVLACRQAILGTPQGFENVLGNFCRARRPDYWD